MPSLPPDQPEFPQQPSPEDGGAAQPPTPDADGYCRLALVKRGQRYLFRYRPGEEAALLASLIELARDPSSDLDWYDAALLSHQMGQKLSAQMQRVFKI